MDDRRSYMNQKISGIKWKLFAYLLGFCLLLLLILTLFQTVFLDRFYKSIKTNQVTSEMVTISAYVEAADWSSLTDLGGGPDDLFVEVWSMERTLVASSGSFREGIHTQLKPDEMDDLIAQLQAQGGTLTRRYDGKDKGKRPHENIVSAQLVQSADGNTYVVLASAEITPVNATVETLRVQLLYISGIMLLLSVALALLIARKVSKPIEAISRTAGELGKGNYNVVFRGTGYQEVVQLANVLTQAAGELSKTEELRQELISNVSHDLRTPLTLIAGYSEMIRDMPDEANAENMQVIIDETNRLSSLVNDLLDLSQLQAGTQRMSIERFDLNELTEEIAGRVSRFCEQDGYRIAYAPVAEIFVNGDRDRIAQVIYNILLNAITHTGPDKVITIRLIVSGQSARLEVIDTGDGIAPENLPHIWERYYKVDSTHKRATSGSGLGLAIVRSILDRHPGVDYGVESEVGRGSTFWFSIECSEA